MNEWRRSLAPLTLPALMLATLSNPISLSILPKPCDCTGRDMGLFSSKAEEAVDIIYGWRFQSERQNGRMNSSIGRGSQHLLGHYRSTSVDIWRSVSDTATAAAAAAAAAATTAASPSSSTGGTDEFERRGWKRRKGIRSTTAANPRGNRVSPSASSELLHARLQMRSQANSSDASYMRSPWKRQSYTSSDLSEAWAESSSSTSLSRSSSATDYANERRHSIKSRRRASKASNLQLINERDA